MAPVHTYALSEQGQKSHTEMDDGKEDYIGEELHSDGELEAITGKRMS